MQSRPLTDNEITSILGHMTSLRDRTLFMLGLKSGFRISEILSLKVEDVMQFGAVSDSITVRRSSMKGKRQSRTIPLHPLAKQVLRDYLQSRSYDLKSRLFEMTRQHAWRTIKCAARKAHLSGCISTHSMRKTFGMGVYNRTGRNIVAAQRALGHASLASTSHYLSVDQDIVDNAILAG